MNPYFINEKVFIFYIFFLKVVQTLWSQDQNLAPTDLNVLSQEVFMEIMKAYRLVTKYSKIITKLNYFFLLIPDAVNESDNNKVNL
jgi:hypothetical protein